MREGGATRTGWIIGVEVEVVNDADDAYDARPVHRTGSVSLEPRLERCEEADCR